MKKRLIIYLFLVPWAFGFLPFFHFLTKPTFSSESGYTPKEGFSDQIIVHLIWLLPIATYAIWELLKLREASQRESK